MTKYLAEVWTGDQWFTLGVYQNRRSAQRRVDRSKSNQEHRVRPFDPNKEPHHEANIALRDADDRKAIREKY
jgi:hypothetical protein